MISDAPSLTSDVSPHIVLVLFVVVACAAAAVAVRLAVVHRDPLPIVVSVGALVCAFNEPIYDILGKITYAEDHAMAFTAFGRSIPWFLVIGYLPWVGVLPYVVARAMANGVPRHRLHWLAFGSFLSVVVVESFGTSVDSWLYYGDAPLRFLVVAPQMAPVPVVGGFLLYAIAFRLRGWRRVASGFAISTLALPMVFASASWPLYVGLYSSLPVFVDWLLGLAMLALSAAIVWAATGLADLVHRGDASRSLPGDGSTDRAVELSVVDTSVKGRDVSRGASCTD